MMWDHVMTRVTAMLLADGILQTLIGENLRMAGTADLEIPLLEYTVLTDTEGELWAPISVQFDIWMGTMAELRGVERRLHQLLHKDLPQMVGDLRMTTIYTDGTFLSTPDRSGFHGRAVRYHFTPLREQYADVSP